VYSINIDSIEVFGDSVGFLILVDH